MKLGICQACLEQDETVADRGGVQLCEPCAEHFDNQDAMRADELRQALEQDLVEDD